MTTKGVPATPEAMREHFAALGRCAVLEDPARTLGCCQRELGHEGQHYDGGRVWPASNDYLRGYRNGVRDALAGARRATAWAKPGDRP